MIVDLDIPPENRWEALQAEARAVQELGQCYTRELKGFESALSVLDAYVSACISPERRAEIQCVARVCEVPSHEVLLGNLYYDALKFVWGCSAFAVDTPAGPLHARNLDWWCENDLLARHTRRFEFRRRGRIDYVTVGWPGFIGCFSGVASGRFAVTLNAVLSGEPGALEQPIVFVLREALERAATFADAVTFLSTARVASDSLLLVTGTRSGEMAVIERTPTRAEIRRPENGFVAVTNDYRMMKSLGAGFNALIDTACGRYNRMYELLSKALPRDPNECLSILCDPQVRMGMTVQQMVFCAATGDVWLASDLHTRSTPI